jgi:hypothetical protein
LLSAREARIRPGLDDKILADWNGYFIRALAEAAFTFTSAEWLDHAEKAFRFIAESMNAGGKLSHSWREGVSVRPAMATDYGAMINAALTLHEVTSTAAYLDAARAWQGVLDADYADGNGGYFLTSAEAEALITRPRANMDDANPSGASQILEGLVRLATLSGDEKLLERAWALTRNLHAFASGSRYGIAGYHNAVDTLQRQRHVSIHVKDRAATESFLAEIRHVADPALTFAVVLEGKPATSFGAELDPSSEAPGAIMCTQQACSAPIVSPEGLRKALIETSI